MGERSRDAHLDMHLEVLHKTNKNKKKQKTLRIPAVPDRFYVTNGTSIFHKHSCPFTAAPICFSITIAEEIYKIR